MAELALRRSLAALRDLWARRAAALTAPDAPHKGSGDPVAEAYAQGFRECASDLAVILELNLASLELTAQLLPARPAIMKKKEANDG